MLTTQSGWALAVVLPLEGWRRVSRRMSGDNEVGRRPRGLTRDIRHRFAHHATNGEDGAGLQQGDFQIAIKQALVSVGLHLHKPPFAPHAQPHVPLGLQRSLLEIPRSRLTSRAQTSAGSPLCCADEPGETQRPARPGATLLSAS